MSGSVTLDAINGTDIEANSVFLNDYLALKEKLSGRLAQDMHTVLNSWVDWKTRCAVDNHHFGSGYNPLARIPIKEPVHSRIIGDFLDPKGSHGQGTLFLQCFLEQLEVPDAEKGVWRISIEAGRVDILLWRDSPASMIIIENKVKDAVDQPNQIYRYWHHQMYRWKPEHWRNEQTKRSFRLVYMPADGSKEPAKHSLQRPLDWGDEINDQTIVPLTCEPISLRDVMTKWREAALEKVPASNHRLHVFFKLYEELWIRL